jgi:hypothetical protein
MQNSPDTTLQIPRDAQMTLTRFRGRIVTVLLDVAIQQHDECFFGRLVCRAVRIRMRLMERRIQRPPGREMLIPLIQSKWDAGPKTVLRPSRLPATYLRNADGRADNMKP